MTDPILMHGDGWIRCCICGERHDRPFPRLHSDDSGLWDVCVGQCAIEAGLIEQRHDPA
jgi:hypothetical protein